MLFVDHRIIRYLVKNIYASITYDISIQTAIIYEDFSTKNE